MSQRHLAPLATGALLALLAASTPARSAADDLQTAGIDHGALVVRAGTGPVRIVQGGGAARLLPVWSADGTRIAFVQLADRRQALAELVVVSEAGVELARVAIEPVTADTAYAGMRFVEAVRWIAPDRVAVRGSLNPSQSQYYVVDVANGRIVDDFIDDRSAAAFSPDGRHVATQSGSPHFLAADRRVPQLNIDGRPVYPGAGRGDADIVGEPRWSADSRSLAWLLRLKADGSTTLAVWRDGTLHESAVPAARGTQPGLFWQGARVVVTAPGAGAGSAAPRAWAFDATGGAPKPLAAALDPLADARSLRDRLAAEARAAGLAQPDLWCRACGLEALPRASE
jgi:dipeptidyl aminopeptidase/acylaminoacyl peptidase